MLVGVEMLEFRQQDRDFVPELDVRFDVLELNLAGFNLRIA